MAGSRCSSGADDEGKDRPWRPRIAVKAIDSKRSLKKFRKIERDADNFTGHCTDHHALLLAKMLARVGLRQS